jgi:hypothetical protein
VYDAEREIICTCELLDDEDIENVKVGCRTGCGSGMEILKRNDWNKGEGCCRFGWSYFKRDVTAL